MTEAHMWAPLQRLLPIILASVFGVFAALPASAQGSAQSFVQDEFYLGHEGGSPPSLQAFAENPRAYLRSEAAYTALRQRFATVLGRSSLSEEDFTELLNSDQVRLRSCSSFGRFQTMGILTTDVVVQSPRTTCYAGEKFIEVLVHGQWIVAASQGCFNPVTIPPVSVIPPPRQPVCRWVTFSDPVGAGTHQHFDGTWHPSNCGNPLHVPGYTVQIPNTTQSSGGYRICE